MSDLVARARDEAKLWTVLYRDSLLWKMSDEIERLTEEVDRMRPVVEAARRYVGDGDYAERLLAGSELEIALRELERGDT